MILEGYAIVPPVSPWEEKYKHSIIMDNVIRTIGRTEAEAWSIHCRRGLDYLSPGEFSHRVQHWYDRGYRVKSVKVEIFL